MEQNIFQVINEAHLDEILANHIRDMVVVMLSSKQCNPCKLIKPKFVELSKIHKDVFFVYIDRENYNSTNDKYFKEFEYTPTFVFYFGNNKIAFVEGGHEPSLVRSIMVLKQKIDAKKQEVAQQEKALAEQKMKELEAIKLKQQQPQITEDMIILSKKMEMLQRLRDLTNNGIKLTKNYNLDSSLEEMIQEFQIQMQKIQQVNVPQQQEQVSPQQNTITLSTESNLKEQEELNKKQEQVKQIRELDMLNQKMQAQSLQKLQQLRRIQQMKEQQEKNNEKQQ